MEYEAGYRARGKSENVNKAINKGLKFSRITIIFIYIIFSALFIYFYTPVLNPIYSSSYIFIILNIFFILLIVFWKKIQKTYVKRIFSTVFILSIVIYIMLTLLSSPILNSKKYYNLVGEVAQYNYEDEKDKLNTQIIPIVDYQLAQKLGDKVLGEDLGLGSQYEIGEYYLISTPDDIVWVAPLEPQNFFKWLQNNQGSPGYIYVSATNPNDVRLVQDIDGQEIRLKYTNKSYFNNNIKRHTYLNNNFTKGMIDYSFEIDDKGMPYWVITTYKPTIGFSGEDVSGVIVVDAQTGEVNSYSQGDENIPKWIDRVYPKSMVLKQLDYYGAYKNGWFNTITAQKEMVKPTDGISYIFIDGKPYFYTGMTSIKSDESTVGFILHSLKDKETSFYKVNGATEQAAQKSAQGKVQQYNYSASSPILLNIYQKPTYFMTLKDSDGLVKQYALVSVENYNIVGTGFTVDEAKKDYYNQLKNNNEISKDEVDEKDITGTIERINFLDNVYYFKLEGSDDLYLAEKDLSQKLVLTQPGDSVEIKYLKSDGDAYSQITYFDNKTF